MKLIPISKGFPLVSSSVIKERIDPFPNGCEFPKNWTAGAALAVPRAINTALRGASDKFFNLFI
jgi:hypothetical protein